MNDLSWLENLIRSFGYLESFQISFHLIKNITKTLEINSIHVKKYQYYN